MGLLRINNYEFLFLINYYFNVRSAFIISFLTKLTLYKELRKKKSTLRCFFILNIQTGLLLLSTKGSLECRAGARCRTRSCYTARLSFLVDAA